MTQEHWHPGKILEVSGYYWRSCALHAAVKLDFFTIVGDESLPAAAVAEKADASTDGAERLLNAMVALGLMTKIGDAFANTSASRAFLCKDSEKYIGYMILHHHYLVESWSRLDEAVRTGKAVRGRASFSDPKQREAFLMGMFNNAMLLAPKLVESVDLSGRTHLLDMGGGPGTYAIHFCKKHPELKATVFDLPTTRPFAEKTIARFGLSDRIDFTDGDYTSEALSGRFDAVWMSHILHGDSPETCRQMVQKAVDVLAPGGMLMIHDFILEDTGDAPLFPALFSLNMLQGTDGGRSYTQGELTGMMQNAGLSRIERLPYKSPMESGIMVGHLEG